jgi:hypothetical protein
MDCDAIHPPGALRAANRRTGLVIPENQKNNHNRLCFYAKNRRRQISTKKQHR